MNKIILNKEEKEKYKKIKKEVLKNNSYLIDEYSINTNIILKLLQEKFFVYSLYSVFGGEGLIKISASEDGIDTRQLTLNNYLKEWS